jgi:hypothetical protein
MEHELQESTKQLVYLSVGIGIGILTLGGIYCYLVIITRPLAGFVGLFLTAVFMVFCFWRQSSHPYIPIASSSESRSRSVFHRVFGRTLRHIHYWNTCDLSSWSLHYPIRCSRLGPFSSPHFPYRWHEF